MKIFQATPWPRLEAAGNDVVSVRTVAPGSKDADILALAVRERRRLRPHLVRAWILNLSAHPAMSGSMQHNIDADSIVGKDN